MPESKGRRQRKTNSSRARRRGSGTSTTPSAPETGRKFTWPRLGFRLRARTWRRVRRWSFIGAAAMFAALIIGSFALSSFPGGIFGQGGAASADGAQIGDHWHASLLMEVCGQDIDLPPSDGGIHSHGDRFIHIHPYIADEVGLAANIGRFFDSFPLEMDFDRVETPEGGLFRNGDTCPDGTTGTVQVLVNGQDITESARGYTPEDEDAVEVYFRQAERQEQQDVPEQTNEAQPEDQEQQGP